MCSSRLLKEEVGHEMTLSGKWPFVVHCCILAVAVFLAVSGSVTWHGNAVQSQSLTARVLDDLDKGNDDIR